MTETTFEPGNHVGLGDLVRAYTLVLRHVREPLLISERRAYWLSVEKRLRCSLNDHQFLILTDEQIQARDARDAMKGKKE